MVAMLVRLAVRRSLRDTRHVKVVAPRKANGVVAEVYRQVERDFRMLAPPVALHSAAPEVLAASWMILRETLLAQGVADRASKEAVATGVSVANECPYCADVHGMTLAALADAADRSELEAWAQASATAAAAAAPPFPPEQGPELIGVAVAFQYYNRMVNVFLRDSPFPSHVPESAKPKARHVLGGVLRPSDGGALPGASLDLLPPAPLPEDLSWALANPSVADAFARAYAAVEAAGDRSVPSSVRALVHSRLSTWDGEAPGISRAWVEEAVVELPEADRAAGRLALLIAHASYQVDETLVDDFRRTAPDDATLIELAAWSSMAAARRISVRLAAQAVKPT
ncbi:alkylhydroperoxidase AhpD family core domain-containing protein [Actinokineospora alba]|uniref:Alkylhydroperoxidase AhpD family core domain-containing protein n=1 Tax=Actinokineospora alba TaxID=504798 RepID=A0A1H0HEE0_9PSEU|nr:carboxymuconolactone decarboxylase family protein [Actinokineospora alba]TDP64918.1 AhpD family alkylhydroperoxidase [Actinokineospora alba]SDH49360.1 alkylhydroperoxidase AhpD family core domain-containing protein [Actinokineospora alba]SDO17535.1 alkylhydroperoxidase AhpD family core domain-containing protein [Actinokineospora alba]